MGVINQYISHAVLRVNYKGAKPLFIVDIARSRNFYYHQLRCIQVEGTGMKELCTVFLCYAVNNSCTNSNFVYCSGGTDIISCFAGQNPTVPVYRGEIQTRNLGMAVESWNDEGNMVITVLF